MHVCSAGNARMGYGRRSVHERSYEFAQTLFAHENTDLYEINESFAMTLHQGYLSGRGEVEHIGC